MGWSSCPGSSIFIPTVKDAENYRLKALDGVTTALELEIGVSDVAGFITERTGQALVNFGATASHPAVRVATLGAPMPTGAIVPQTGPATDRPITDAQFEQVATSTLNAASAPARLASAWGSRDAGSHAARGDSHVQDRGRAPRADLRSRSQFGAGGARLEY